MDTKTEIREFLSTRRAKVTPADAGIVSYGERRVPGLRRGEVAQLAGVSVEYYTRIERGNLSSVSDGVLESLSRALHLDEAERAHLFDLARDAGAPGGSGRGASRRSIRPSVQRTLEGFSAPAYVRDRRRDILAANPLAEVLYSLLFEDPFRPVNTARFTFLSERAQSFFVDWNGVARDAVAALRSEAGSNPYDQSLAHLVGELSTRSEAFRKLWAEHDVRFHTTGAKRVDHPVVGELELIFEAMEIAADPGLTIVTYSAEPGSHTEEGLVLLATLAATDQAERSRATDATRSAP